MIDKRMVQLSANDTNNRVIPLSRFIPGAWITKLKLGLLASGVTGSNNLQFQLVVQGANTTRESPGAWNTSFDTGWRTLSTASNYEVCTGEMSLPTGFGSPLRVRVGAVYALSTGTTQTSAMLTACTTIRGN